MEKNDVGQAVQSNHWLDSQWMPMGECTHCGRAMEGRPARNDTGITIVGAEPMEYRHTHDRTRECAETKVYPCGPYESWGQYAKWLKVKSNGELTGTASARKREQLA